MDNQEILKMAKENLKLLNYVPGYKKKVGKDYWVNPCPYCGGKDHFTIYPNTNSYSSFTDCCKGGSIIDYMIEIEGMEKPFAIKRVLELTGYTQDFNNNKNTSMKRSTKTMNKQAEKPISNAVTSKKDIDLTNSIQDYYNKNNFDRTYFFNRGITQKVIDKYKMLVGDPKVVLKNNIELLPGLKNISSYEYILPQWEDGKVVSLIGRRNDNKSIENSKTFNLKGIEQKIFNMDLLKSDKNIIFITESIFDSLSIESISDSYHSISLNSTQMSRRFIDQVKKNIDNCKDKVFILCGDNDKSGIKMNSTIIDELKILEIKSIKFDMMDYGDINDFAVKDSNKFSYKLHEVMQEINSWNSGFEYMDKFLMDSINDLKNYKVKSTGFYDLNNKFNGGLHSGLYVLGAISSLGKTTFIHQVADNVASSGNKVLFFSLEQSKFELVSKSLSRETSKIDLSSGLTAREIMTGKLNSNMQTAVTNYTDASKNIYLYEGNFNTTVKTIRDTIEKHVKWNNNNPLVIVDYLQILQALDVRMSDKQKVETNVTELKRISRDFNIPLVVVSALNRDSYCKPISFESFKETGGIEYTADVLLGLQYHNIDVISQEKNKTVQADMLRQESLKYPREVDLVCKKQRNGQQDFSCGFEFYPKNNIFVERE